MDEPTSPWRGRRVLVTGCTGFLGGAVVRELLARGAVVVGLVRDRAAGDAFTRHQLAGRAHVVRGRTEDLFRVHSALAVHEAGAVFHLAANDLADRGTATVLEAVRRYDPRVPVVTARPAGAAPVADCPVALGVARFGELFGGGDRNPDRVVPATIHTVLTGGRVVPTGDTPARDFVHVADAARACVLLAEAVGVRGGPHVRDEEFRSGWAFTGRGMAAAVRDVLAGRDLLPIPTELPANPMGWSPSLKFTVALAETIDWYRDSLHARASGRRPVDPPHRAAA